MKIHFDPSVILRKGLGFSASTPSPACPIERSDRFNDLFGCSPETVSKLLDNVEFDFGGVSLEAVLATLNFFHAFPNPMKKKAVFRNESFGNSYTKHREVVAKIASTISGVSSSLPVAAGLPALDSKNFWFFTERHEYLVGCTGFDKRRFFLHQWGDIVVKSDFCLFYLSRTTDTEKEYKWLLEDNTDIKTSEELHKEFREAELSADEHYKAKGENRSGSSKIEAFAVITKLQITVKDAAE